MGQARLVLPAALKRSWYWTCSGMKEPSPEASWLQQAVVYTTCGQEAVVTSSWSGEAHKRERTGRALLSLSASQQASQRPTL